MAFFSAAIVSVCLVVTFDSRQPDIPDVPEPATPVALDDYNTCAITSLYCVARLKGVDVRLDTVRRLLGPGQTRMLSGPAVLLCKPNYDWTAYSSQPGERREWVMGSAFIHANTPHKMRWCFVVARWSLIPALLLGAFSGYCLSRKVYGETAGLVFLVLFCLSPLQLAWGATICPDAVASAAGLVAVHTFRNWLSVPNWARAGIAGVCLGLLPLTKLTWIIAFALWPVIWCVWATPIFLTRPAERCIPLPPFRQLTVLLLLAVYTLNTGYLFDGTFRPLGKYIFKSRLFRGLVESSSNPLMFATENRVARTSLGEIPVPLPADFVQGIDTQRLDFERGLPSYLRGQWADHGWWYYYLYVLVVKEPLGTWCLVALAMAATLFGRGYSASWRNEMLVLVPFLVIFVFVSSQTGFSVHSRYILPALPLLFVWASKVARMFEMRPFTRSRRVIATMVCLAIIWSVGSSLSIYPHSLSYFNELAALLPTPADVSYPRAISDDSTEPGILSKIERAISAGPRNGPRHLLDSNIDAGQDLFCLSDWLDSHSNVKLDGLAYSGSYPYSFAGISNSRRSRKARENGGDCGGVFVNPGGGQTIST